MAERAKLSGQVAQPQAVLLGKPVHLSGALFSRCSNMAERAKLSGQVAQPQAVLLGKRMW